MKASSHKKILLLSAVFATLMFTGISPAEALTVSEFKTIITERFQMGKDIMILAGYFFATILLLVGAGFIYKNSKQPDRDHLKVAFVAWIVAGILFSIAGLADLAADATTGTQNGSSGLTKKTL